MRADYDSEADALYVELRQGCSAPSVELGRGMMIHLDPGRRPLGVEILSPGRGFADRLAEAERRFGIDAVAVTAAACAAVAAPDRTVHIEVSAGREPLSTTEVRPIREDPR